MRVVFNGLSTLKRKTGIGHYAESLYLHLCRLSAETQVEFYPDPWTARLARVGYRFLAERSRPAAEQKSSRCRFPKGVIQRCLGFLRHSAWRSLGQHFRLASSGRGYDLYHEPNFLPLPSELPTITTIHDLSVLLYPQWHPVSRVQAHEVNFYAGLKQTSHFIAVSEFTRHEMIQRLGIRADRVTAVPNGIRPHFRPLPDETVRATLQRLRLPSQYLLYVGTIEPRKNLLLLLRAYCDLPAPLRRDWPLVLVGGFGWGADEVLDYFHTTAQHRGVIRSGYITDDDLPAVFNGARALVYPSYYEGFGLPPAEMLACGGAVLASTAGAIREVLGNCGWLIDADDFAGWRDAMRTLLSDPERCRELRRGSVQRAAVFSWERCARETLAVYRQVA